MLGRIWRWLWGGPSEEPFDLYRPRERLIYRYFDGKRVVDADPMELFRRQADVGPELSAHIKGAFSPLKTAPQEYQWMLEKIRTIFGVAPFKDGGLTDLETVDLLNHFLVWQGRLKKNSSPPPTLPEAPSGPTPAPISPSPDVGPPTSSSSGSGSTATAPPTGCPT